MRAAIHKRQAGAGLTEYALAVALIAVVAMAGVAAVGGETADKVCGEAFIADTAGTVQLNAKFIMDRAYYDVDEEACCLKNPFGPPLQCLSS